jgi:type IV secretion system protein VirB1
MTLHALALAALVARCAPTVAPSTMAAIVQVESGGDPIAIGDNTTRRSYYPRDRATAEALARRLLKVGHSVDLGIAQIDSMNLTGFGVNAHTIFDPCINLSVSARILSGDYAAAARRYGNRQIALRHAIGMYNTGRLDAGEAYVRRVLAAAGILERHPLIWKRDLRRASRLVRMPAPVRELPSNRHEPVTPSRAPILIAIPRRSIVTAFSRL